MKVSHILNAFATWVHRNEDDLRNVEAYNLEIEKLLRNIDRLLFEREVYSGSEDDLFSDVPHYISQQTVELTLKGLIRDAIIRMMYRFDSHHGADQIYNTAKQHSIIGDNELRDILDI